jgi:hypothetical protein
MFNCGLSEPLVQAMKSLAENIKPLLPTIQGKKKKKEEKNPTIVASAPFRFVLVLLTFR